MHRLMKHEAQHGYVARRTVSTPDELKRAMKQGWVEDTTPVAAPKAAPVADEPAGDDPPAEQKKPGRKSKAAPVE